MLGFGEIKHLWLYTGVADMRKSYNGLSALVKTQMLSDPLSGDGFIFINRRRTQLKCLYYDSGGYCLWGKRLEQGQYAMMAGSGSNRLALSNTELSALLDGYDIIIKRQRKRYKKRENHA